MSGYFADIAARGAADDAPGVVPDRPVSVERAEMDDPFVAIDESAPGAPAGMPAGPDRTGRSLVPNDRTEDRTQGPLPPAAAEPPMRPPVDVRPPAPRIERRDDEREPRPMPVGPPAQAGTTSTALDAMDRMLFDAAGLEPPTEIASPDEPAALVATLTEPMPPVEPMQVQPDPVTTGGSTEQVTDRVEVREMAEPNGRADATIGPGPAAMTPAVAERADPDPMVSDVQIGQITVEVRQPSVLPATATPATRSRPVRYPRAQRTLRPQRRTLR